MSETSGQIVEKITDRLGSSQAIDLSALQSTIEKLNERIYTLEAQMTQKSQIAISKSFHPSLEKFNIAEAVEELAEFLQQEKACTFEPGNKPCDHCSMCGSRGF